MRSQAPGPVGVAASGAPQLLISASDGQLFCAAGVGGFVSLPPAKHPAAKASLKTSARTKAASLRRQHRPRPRRLLLSGGSGR